MSAMVYRITVDERLADDLIRVLKCPLAEGVRAFFDRDGDWDAERQNLIRSGDYVRKLGIPNPEDWPWEALSEGQVFLSGEFDVVLHEEGEKRGTLAYFKVHRGKRIFLRIDEHESFRDGVRRMYAFTLAGR